MPDASTQTTSFLTGLFGPLFDPLNQDSDWYTRALVWGDFRIAVALFVVAPLILFFWSFTQTGTNDAVKRVLIGYWEASSLLMLTVFLNIAQMPIGSFTGLFVQCLMPISLIWWKDLLEEINEDDSALARTFKLWRPAAIGASVVGVLIQLPFQGCNFVASPVSNPMCAAWIEPPSAFHDLFLDFVSPSSLAFAAYAGCLLYFSYLAYLATYIVPRVGRLGRKDRNAFSAVSALKKLGLINVDSPGN